MVYLMLRWVNKRRKNDKSAEYTTDRMISRDYKKYAEKETLFEWA